MFAFVFVPHARHLAILLKASICVRRCICSSVGLLVSHITAFCWPWRIWRLQSSARRLPHSRSQLQRRVFMGLRAVGMFVGSHSRLWGFRWRMPVWCVLEWLTCRLGTCFLLFAMAVVMCESWWKAVLLCWLARALVSRLCAFLGGCGGYNTIAVLGGFGRCRRLHSCFGTSPFRPGCCQLPQVLFRLVLGPLSGTIGQYSPFSLVRAGGHDRLRRSRTSSQLFGARWAGDGRLNPGTFDPAYFSMHSAQACAVAIEDALSVICSWAPPRGDVFLRRVSVGGPLAPLDGFYAIGNARLGANVVSYLVCSIAPLACVQALWLCNCAEAGVEARSFLMPVSQRYGSCGVLGKSLASHAGRVVTCGLWLRK